VRFFLLVLAILCPLSAWSETVRLRHAGNGNIIDIEVVEITAEAVTFRLPQAERIHTIKWESLDLDWIKIHSPALWNERELLIKPPQPEAPPKVEPEIDPFAKETLPEDTRAILRNLASNLTDRAKGIEPGRIESFCRELKLDEEVFWRAYDEMRRESFPAALADKGEKSQPSRKREGKVNEWERNPAFRAKEDALRHQTDKGQGGLTYLVYLRALSEGGFKGRVAWQLLRFQPEEKNALMQRLQKYETQAAELATRAASTDVRRDALVLRKQLADLLVSLAKVTRESSIQEERLKSEATSLLARLAK